MWPDSDWLNALKLPLRVVSGLLLASVAVLVLDTLEWIPLDLFGSLARPAVRVLFVVTLFLVLTNVGGMAVDWQRRRRARAEIAERRDKKQSAARELELQEKRAREVARDETRRRVLSRIDHLSTNEFAVLAHCLREDTQTYFGYVHGHAIGALVAKELLYPTGGTHHEDHYPFIIYDYVWEHMLQRKDELLAVERERREEEARRMHERGRQRGY